VLAGKPPYATRGRGRGIGVRNPFEKEEGMNGRMEKRKRIPEVSTLEPMSS
jgi:hypothetical protein